MGLRCTVRNSGIENKRFATLNVKMHMLDGWIDGWMDGWMDG